MGRLRKGICGTVCEDREAWLAFRRQSVGGSDAGAVLNEHEYEDAYTLWCDKTQQTEGVKRTEAMRLGNALEEYAAERFCEIRSAETGKPVRVRRRAATLRNEKYPFAHANVDREIVGERSVLECKTSTGPTMEAVKRGELPRMWYWQLQHYLAVGEYERAWLICVDRTGRNEPVICEIGRCEKDIDRLMSAEAAFMESVRSGNAPKASGIERGKAVNKERWPEETKGETVALGNEWEGRLAERARMKDAANALEKQARAIETELQKAMGTGEQAVCGAWRVSWKTQKTGAIDRERLAADHPAVDPEKYKGQSRVLRIVQRK